ncbi:hypothetical protein LCGC14_2335520 [marine sediment metagenome]|uniref:Uncharacterized protein n=1 Tax=marine sediment metagenome TaxID=412755 RepID=A0A0F9F8M0_9ZZZZ
MNKEQDVRGGPGLVGTEMEEQRVADAAQKQMTEVYEFQDITLHLLSFSRPSKVRIVIDEKFVRLYVGPRDWQFDRITKECAGSGVGLGPCGD